MFIHFLLLILLYDLTSKAEKLPLTPSTSTIAPDSNVTDSEIEAIIDSDFQFSQNDNNFHFSRFLHDLKPDDFEFYLGEKLLSLKIRNTTFINLFLTSNYNRQNILYVFTNDGFLYICGNLISHCQFTPKNKDVVIIVSVFKSLRVFFITTTAK